MAGQPQARQRQLWLEHSLLAEDTCQCPQCKEFSLREELAHPLYKGKVK